MENQGRDSVLGLKDDPGRGFAAFVTGCSRLMGTPSLVLGLDTKCVSSRTPINSSKNMTKKTQEKAKKKRKCGK